MTPLHFALKLECLPNSSAVILLRTQKQAPNTQNGSHAAIPELCRLLTAGGHCCEVHDMQRWGRDDNDIDVVVRIPGPKSVRDETLSVPYRPKPWNLNLALTDDPSQLPLAEYYDGILPLNLVGEQPDGGGPAQRLEREVFALLSPGTKENAERLERIRLARERISSAAYRQGGPLVSVLISTHNRRQTLPRAIESLIAQTYKDWELLLVQDGGVRVGDIVDSFHDSRIQLIRREQNGGMARGYHTAFEHAHGRYIAWLSDDDIWYPEHLERLMLALRELPGVRFAYTDATRVLLNMRETPPRELERGVVYDRQLCLADIMESNGITGISPVHDRELYIQAGGLDPKQKVLIDFDLWRRMASLSCPCRVDAVTAEYYLKQGDKRGQLTALYTKSPGTYRVQRLRVLSKKLPLKAASPLWEVWRRLRRQAVQNYAVFRGLDALEAKDERKTAIFRKLARRTLDPSSIQCLRDLALFELANSHPAEAFQLLFQILTSNQFDAEPSDLLHGFLAALLENNTDHAEQISNMAARAEAVAHKHRLQLFSPSEQAQIAEYRAKLAQMKQADV